MGWPLVLLLIIQQGQTVYLIFARASMRRKKCFIILTTGVKQAD
jgi:hypothetical protein